MVIQQKKVLQPSRVTTGVPGLDVLLNGGFLEGGIYLLMGPPGSGKTILGNQICFEAIRNGGTAVFATLLSESHGQMLRHLQEMKFFDPHAVSHSMNYFSAYRELEKSGLAGLLQQLRTIVHKQKPRILVIDGFAVADEESPSPMAFKKFIQELGSFTRGSGCTVFFLSSIVVSLSRPEHTMVDGIVLLDIASTDMRTRRLIEVRKFRGSDHFQGKHSFKISTDGLSVFPRFESHRSEPTGGHLSDSGRLSTGVAAIDKLLGGGVPRTSITMLGGSGGSGKTILGLQFLYNCVRRRIPSLYFGFYERPEQIIDKAGRLNMEFKPLIERGLLDLRWNAPEELLEDEIAAELISLVRRKKIGALFVDGVDGFKHSGMPPHRLRPFFIALANELRHLQVTTFLTEEGNLFAAEMLLPISDMSAVSDNIIAMQQLDTEVHRTRILSLVKVRDSDHDSQVYEFGISDKGLVLKNKTEGVDLVHRRQFAHRPK